MTGKMLNRLVILLLVAALAAVLISPVLAADTVSAPNNTDQAELTNLAVPQENIQGFDQDSHTAIPAPYALTEVKGLTIDPALLNATPYWVYLAAGKKEQQALTNYIRNSDIPQKKKTEWIGFLQASWKKYPLKFIRKGSSATITLAKPQKEYSLTRKEAATFAEIDDQVTADMEQTASQGIHPMFAYDQHTDFMTSAMKTENYIPDNFKLIANTSATVPDTWYSNDEAGKLLHSLNHGYMPLTPTSGLGLAPQNTGTYAVAAKADYLTKNYDDAFTSLGYSSHFMGDLGQPFHTPNPVLLVQADWLFYDIGPFSGNLATKIRHYEIFHDGYENNVDKYWTQNTLPETGKNLSYYADADTGATTIVDPTTSATLHADASSVEVIPLFYLCEWHYFFNKDFDYMSDPVIAGITIDRVQASVENIRGLVRFVTGGQAPTPTSTEWNWATDGWGDWQHTATWSGGSGSEYGPVMVNDGEGNHGEHGADVSLNGGSTQASVWRTFTDPTGVGWNTITFKGLMTASDRPDGRWMTINVNGNQVFGGTASQSPPGNGVPFEIKSSFAQSPTVTVTIANGQNPAWGPRFAMHYYSVTLSRESTTTLMKTQNTPFVIPDGHDLVVNGTPSEKFITT